jgi:hypothetical protein
MKLAQEVGAVTLVEERLRWGIGHADLGPYENRGVRARAMYGKGRGTSR